MPENSNLLTQSDSRLRQILGTLLFDTEHPAGKYFNITIILLIMAAVLASMANTINHIHAQWGHAIETFEHSVLILFAIEYVARIYAAPNRTQYIRSFNGIVDFVTVLPLLLSGNSLVVIRMLRLARVIRVAVSIPIVRALFTSLKGSTTLLFGVLMTIGLISILVGNMIYILEPHTFANAFEGTWWSLVTMSTVGYGDFVPSTPIGKTLAAMLIMSGICMFAMVTAVISVKVGRMVNRVAQCRHCHHRIAEHYLYCPYCASAQAQPATLTDDCEQ